MGYTPSDQGHDTGYPLQVEFWVLDLETGRELPLMTQGMDQASRAALQKRFSNWVWGKFERQFLDSLPVDMAQNETMDMAAAYFPPIAFTPSAQIWAPGRERLAVMYDWKIFLFDYNEPASQDASGTFVPAGRPIDLSGLVPEDMDFWDDDTLLVWGPLGMVKIDIALAAQTQANKVIRLNPDQITQ